MSMISQKRIAVSLWAILAGVVCAAPALGAENEQVESFDRLAPVEDVIYLLANSSIIFGADPNGTSEEITFVGPVHVPKFPVATFERRKLENGKYQIDFELTKSALSGESYLLGGEIKLGEDPELRSLGTITQREPGRDYPADFIVQRKVLIETPVGVLKNEDAVPVRGTIDAIPPVRRAATETNINVFRGEELPVQMLNEDGQVGGWFYSKMHLAFAVDPKTIYRSQATGEVVLKKGDKQERVAVEGPVEWVASQGNPQDRPTEMVMVGLRGTSRLLGGPVMFTESFSDKDWFSAGKLGVESNPQAGGDAAFDIYLSIKSPSGLLVADGPIAMKGKTVASEEVDQVKLGDRQIPVHCIRTADGYSGECDLDVVTEAEKATGIKIVSFKMTPGELKGRRPCCPPETKAAE